MRNNKRISLALGPTSAPPRASGGFSYLHPFINPGYGYLKRLSGHSTVMSTGTEKGPLSLLGMRNFGALGDDASIADRPC